MNARHQTLKNRIDRVCRHWKRLILLKGTSITALSTIAFLLFAFLMDSLLELSGSVRFFMLVAIVTTFVITFFWTIVRPLLNVPTQTQLARFIEEKHPDLEDRLVTAIELGSEEDLGTSSRLLLKLLDDARFHVQPLNLSKSLRKKSTIVWSSIALAVSLFLLAWVSANFDFFALKTNRIFSPWKFRNLSLLPKLEITPGDARIPQGSAQEIRTDITGFEPEQVILYYATDDSIWTKTEMDITAEQGVFVYSFFDIQKKTTYYVKADNQLSDIFTFTVYDAPNIKRVDLTYKYPKYTGLKARKETDTGDVWAPEGTLVKIDAITDKPLIGAEIMLEEDQKLSTKISADTVVTTSFKVTSDSYYKIHITDTDGLTNDPPSEYYIHALPDQPPVLSIDRPGADIKASMLEEVPVLIHVQDDYGLPSLKLFYTVNGADDQEIKLDTRQSSKNPSDVQVDQILEFSSDYLFYLENLKVKPGDFLTYYVQAGDNESSNSPETVTSEIYFISIRPFDKEFYRPMSQGGQGGGGGSMGGRLSETQKEIIVATWKFQQKEKKLNKEELADDLKIIIESQKNVQEVAESALMQMQQRSFFTRQSDGDIPKFYSNAIEAMEKALTKLEDSQLKEALVPEREAFQNLLKAEAQLKQVQMQRAQAQGSGNQATMDELARLFEEEMDKLPNKYETLRQNQRQRQDEEMNDALRKVKELARRQQQLNRQARELARKENTPEEKKRRIEELRRKQEELRRETQQLTRQMQRRVNSSLPREVQNNLRRATQEMSNASNNLRKDNTQTAAAKGTRALNRLKRLEDMLQKNQKESLRRQVESLEQQFQRLADAQKDLTRKVKELKNRTEPNTEDMQRAQEKQARLRDDLESSQSQLSSVSRQARENKKELSRQINRLSQEVQQAGLNKKMESAENLLKQNRLNSALQVERDIQKNLEQIKDKLTSLRAAFAESDEEKMELALNQTRRLRENLESLQRETRELQRKEEGKHGQESQNKTGQQRENPRAGPGETKRLEQKVDPQKLTWWNEQIAKNLRNLQHIQRSVQVDSSLSQDFQQVSQNLRDMVRTFSGGLPQRFQLIEQQVLDPLKAFEAELANKLEMIKNKEKLFLAREEKIPPEYKALVEKYYEALSRTGKNN